MIKIKTVISGQIEVNCYLIYDSETLKTLIVDPGEDGDKIIAQIKKDGLKPEMLINTHGHFDHILSDEEIRKEFKIPLAAHKDELAMLSDPNKNASTYFTKPITVAAPELLLVDNQEVELSFTKFKVIHTPGHTKGGICLLFDKFLITGDTLFAGTVGRTDLEDGSHDILMQSIKKLKVLDPNLIVYPGHGSSTTLQKELLTNSYLK